MPLSTAATPGNTSTTRNGSANAPGIKRVSLRGMCNEPSSCRSSPTTRISVGGGSGALLGVAGVARCSAALGAVSGTGAGTNTGSRNVTLAVMRARIGMPSRVAGENCQRVTAMRAALANGSAPSRTLTSVTLPSCAITSSSTTSAAPCAPSGYGTGSAAICAGGTTSSFCADAREGAKTSKDPRHAPIASRPIRVPFIPVQPQLVLPTTGFRLPRPDRPGITFDASRVRRATSWNMAGPYSFVWLYFDGENHAGYPGCAFAAREALVQTNREATALLGGRRLEARAFGAADE